MKLTFLSYLFQRFPLEYSFKMAREYGFDGVEVWGARPHAYSYDLDREAIDRILGYKKKYGQEIPMFTPEILAYPYNLCSRDEKECLETLGYLKASARSASLLGADKMLLTIPHIGYGRDKKKVREQLAEYLKELCGAAGELGVSIVIETLSPSEGNMLTNTAEVREIMDEVDSEYLAVMMDIIPPLVAHEPFSEYFDVFGDKMLYLHVSGTDGYSEAHPQLGDSTDILPLTDLFRVVKRCGYDGWCSIEVLGEPYFRDPELCLSESKRIVDQALREAGISLETC